MSTPATTTKRRRPDGRPSGGTLRPLAAEVSTLHRPDGSASLSSGSTQILAAVYGPAAPRNPNRERSDGAVVSVVFRHGSSGGVSAAAAGYGSTEREIERFLGDAIAACVRAEEYPRCVVEVVVQVIKADGSTIGTALNAAVLALLDAGVSMTGLPIATTCLVLPEGGEGTATAAGPGAGGSDFDLRLDPSSEEEASEDGAVAVIVTDGSAGGESGGVLASMTFGTLALESYLACVEGSERASKAVVAFLRLAVEQKVTREAQTLWSS